LLQTYGLSEVGILRSQSKSADSLWIKVGGDGFETRVVDGWLQIRARSAMLGYLNARPVQPPTGGCRRRCGGRGRGVLRIRGAVELINVGGEKVYPAEVESVLQSMEGVKDVTVQRRGESHHGQMVTAKVKLTTAETSRVQETDAALLLDNTPDIQDPAESRFVTEAMHGERFKKLRSLS